MLQGFPAHAAPPPLLITEIQSSGIFPLEDAVEIFNPTGSDVDITGWQLQIYDENDALSDTLVIPNYKLSAGRTVVIGDGNGSNNETQLFFPGSAWFWQANEAGACALLDSNGDGVDFVRWDGSGVAPPASLSFSGTVPFSAMNRGTSLSRDSRFSDSDRASDWCLRPATLGTQNVDDCLSDAIRISEINANGPAAADQIELHNRHNISHNIGNLRILIYNENDAVTDTIVLPNFVLQPGTYVIIHDQAGTNDGGNLYFDNAAIFWQENEPGACALLDGSVNGADFVRWDESNAPVPPGTSFLGALRSSAMNRDTSLSRDSQVRDTDSASDWCLRPDTMGAGNINECISDAIRISEINANGPGAADQVELVNTGQMAHNIEHLQLLVYNQNDAVSDTIVMPNFVLQPGAYVIIHDQAGTNNSGNLYFDNAAIFWQENEPGACGLLDGSVHGIDFVRWDESNAAIPPGTSFTGAVRSSAMNRDTSLSRDSQLLDTDQGSDWCLRPDTMGAPNADECLSDVIRINEIGAEGPVDRIELYNSGTVPHNVEHLQLLIYNQSNQLTETLELPNLVMAPGGFLVIHDQAGTNDNRNLYFDNAAIFWEADEPGACALLDGSVHGIDFVRWDASTVSPPPGAPFSSPNPSGAMTPLLSLARRTDGVDTNSGDDWIIETSTFGSSNPELILEVLGADLEQKEITLRLTGLEIGAGITIEVSVELNDDWKEIADFQATGRTSVLMVSPPDGEPAAYYRALMRR